LHQAGEGRPKCALNSPYTIILNRLYFLRRCSKKMNRKAKNIRHNSHALSATDQSSIRTQTAVGPGSGHNRHPGRCLGWSFRRAARSSSFQPDLPPPGAKSGWRPDPRLDQLRDREVARLRVDMHQLSPELFQGHVQIAVGEGDKQRSGLEKDGNGHGDVDQRWRQGRRTIRRVRFRSGS